MSTFAAARLLQINDNVTGIAAIALLAAVQGVEFHMPMRTSEPLQEAMAEIRSRVPHYAEDRFFAPDIEMAKAHILSLRALDQGTRPFWWPTRARCGEASRLARCFQVMSFLQTWGDFSSIYRPAKLLTFTACSRPRGGW